MTHSVIEFYQNRKGYNMAILIPGVIIEPNPNRVPVQPTPASSDK